MSNDSLQTLLRQLHESDSTALEALYHQLSTPVYTVILRMTGNAALSEDILQEFFIKLYRCPPNPLPRNPRAYLFRMAHNLTIDHLRKEVQSLPLTENVCTAHCVDTSLIERMDLERALASLSREDREIVTLHAGAGLKFREVAEVVSMPLGTVLWRYQRAIGTLQELLKGGSL